MGVFDADEFDDHERVVFCRDPEAGLRAIIAVHSTVLGPALGGCRMWPYGSEADALTDALRLSQAMTYKHALAGTGQGGGKAVIIGDAKTDKTPVLMRAMGRAVDALGGRYIVAEDVGTSVEDMAAVREVTRHVAGIAEGGSGDPSPVDVFAPCALGGVLNNRTIPAIAAPIVAGAANNQLDEDSDGTALAGRGILYAPDYAINAGGIINIAFEGDYDRDLAMRRTEGIFDTLLEIFRRADAEGVPTNQVADRLAFERIETARSPG